MYPAGYPIPNDKPSTTLHRVEWCAFEHEQGGALKFPGFAGIALELHLLDDEDRFLPVWLLASGTLLRTVEPGQT